jgi:hypothetical protein
MARTHLVVSTGHPVYQCSCTFVDKHVPEFWMEKNGWRFGRMEDKNAAMVYQSRTISVSP